MRVLGFSIQCYSVPARSPEDPPNNYLAILLKSSEARQLANDLNWPIYRPNNENPQVHAYTLQEAINYTMCLVSYDITGSIPSIPDHPPIDRSMIGNNLCIGMLQALLDSN